MSSGERDMVKTAAPTGRNLKQHKMKTPFLLCKALVAVLGFSAIPVPAGTWPVWRGDPAMTGVSKESLAFPLPLAWKFAAAKPVKATAVSDGERFYIGDAKGKFFALAAAD